MLAFLLGISITINIVYTIGLIFILKIKSEKDFFNSDFVIDKKEAKEFLSK